VKEFRDELREGSGSGGRDSREEKEIFRRFRRVYGAYPI